MSQSQTPLVDWLIQACETRGLSWAEASRRAGLSQGTISAIVRGTQPGLEICKGLAGFFGVPLEDVLRMAGHMTPVPAPPWPPELVALVREVEDLPPPVRRAVIRAWRAVLEGIQAERDLTVR
jgi:transcriptional regulator with XRE-family HTH domain